MGVGKASTLRLNRINGLRCLHCHHCHDFGVFGYTTVPTSKPCGMKRTIREQIEASLADMPERRAAKRAASRRKNERAAKRKRQQRAIKRAAERAA